MQGGSAWWGVRVLALRRRAVASRGGTGQESWPRASSAGAAHRACRRRGPPRTPPAPPPRPPGRPPTARPARARVGRQRRACGWERATPAAGSSMKHDAPARTPAQNTRTPPERPHLHRLDPLAQRLHVLPRQRVQPRVRRLGRHLARHARLVQRQQVGRHVRRHQRRQPGVAQQALRQRGALPRRRRARRQARGAGAALGPAAQAQQVAQQLGREGRVVQQVRQLVKRRRRGASAVRPPSRPSSRPSRGCASRPQRQRHQGLVVQGHRVQLRLGARRHVAERRRRGCRAQWAGGRVVRLQG